MPNPPFPGRDLPSAILAVLEKHGLCGATLVVGVSGGADSIALLRGLLRLPPPQQPKIVVAHLDHGLREESSSDAQWVRQQCEAENVPLHEHRVDIAAEAAARGRGLEETARHVRRDFLADVAQQADARHIALAHTADDQTETILHRLIRGSGLRGLSGMSEVASLRDGVSIVRPLLNVTRAEIETWLRQIGQDWRTDASNTDPAFTRNRLRHDLLPKLRDEFNPQVDEILRRLGEQSRDVSELVESLASQHLDGALLECRPDWVRLDVTRFSPLHRHLVREVAVLLWRRQKWPLQGMTFEHWDRLAGLMSADLADGGLSLPRHFQATRMGRLLRIEGKIEKSGGLPPENP